MATIPADNYNQVVDMIADYYQTNSTNVVNVLNQYGATNAYDAFELLKDTPYETLYNIEGDPTSYAYNASMEMVQVNPVNSNLNNVARMETQLPISTTYQDPSAPLSGPKYELGARTAQASSIGSTVTTVIDKVGLAVTGVNIGAKLGCWIDQHLYDLNPDWWDEHLPTMNPQTWDTIATTEGGKSFINTLFGVNKSTHESCMYMPTDALAYYALLMQQQGFFSMGGGSVEPPSTIDTDATVWQFGSPYPPVFYTNTITMQYGNGTDTLVTDTPVYGYFVANNASANPSYYTLWIGSKNNFSILVTTPTGTQDTRTPNHYNVTVDGVQYSMYGYFRDYYRTNFGNLITIPDTNGATRSSIVNFDKYLCYFIYNGTVASDLPDGVSHQPNATIPSLNNNDTPTQVDQKLRQQYPDLYQNPIYLPTQQPDGSINDKEYVAIPTIPNPNNSPTPTNTTVTQNDDPIIDPETTPESIIDTIFRYLNPTPPDDTPPDEPDTGDGTSPTIVTPTGEASTLFKIYNPTQAELDAFGAWLWSSNFVEQIKKLFNDPMQSIVGIHKVFATPSIGGSTTIHVGYLDSEVPSDWVDEQYTYVDCGTVNLYEVFGNVFDYGPFTTVRIYLPFIGIVPLDISDVMRSSINVRYGVDVLTGKCLAMVKVTRDGMAGGVIYQYEGSCICRYPYSSGSYMGIVTSVLGAAMAVGTAGSAGMAVLGATTSIANNFRTNVQQGGSFTGEAGAMGCKIPYLIVSRPQPTIADHVERFLGWPANYTATLSSASGFVKVTSCHVETVANATDIEKREIENWLKSGVVIA